VVSWGGIKQKPPPKQSGNRFTGWKAHPQIFVKYKMHP
jgi:hypothetical protein